MRYPYWFAPLVLLAGCSGGREDLAVDACSAEISGKLAGKTFLLDRSDMRAGARADGDDAFDIASSVTFDAGLPGEYRQSFECKARITGNSASVISLTFSW